MAETRCGYVAILGRPNVGKSTLLNRLLGQKVSITSKKPQTTRHQLLGIKTTEDSQVLYVDTPGIHGREPKAINRYMNRSARAVIRDVDLVLFMVDRTHWTEDDQLVADAVMEAGVDFVVVVNKVDLLRDKQSLLPFLAGLRDRLGDVDIVPISAETREQLTVLEEIVSQHLPESPFYFPEAQVTDRSERFLVAEIIREKLMRQLGDELPYELTIQIDRFAREGERVEIDATIFVEREGQKAILIGKGGERLKRVGTDARRDIERLLEASVRLNNWVKVRTGWSNDERAMKSLGYDEL